MRRRLIVVAIVAFGCGFFNAIQIEASFSGSEVFLPSVGKGAGAAGSQWTTTMWIYNPGTDPANVQIMLLLRGQANPSPNVFYETVQPGETVRYEDAIGALFGGSAFGALRIISDERVVVASRIYSRLAGQTEGDSVGQYFAAVPAYFAIGAGQQTSLLGVFQTAPAETSDYRYNFGFVETTGDPVTVEVIVFGGDGSVLGAREYALAGHEPKQINITDLAPGVDTTNARIEVIVVGGTGRIIAFGSGLANASSDPSTFEMAFDDQLLGGGGGGGGGGAVATDQTLIGDGTPGAPLGIADGGVGNMQLGADSVGSGKIVDGTIGPLDLAPGAVRKANIAASGGASGGALTWNGSNLTWKSPITLPASFTASSAATPQDPYNPLFLIENNGDGAAIEGSSINGVGVFGASGYGEAGVVGYGAYLASGVKGSGQRAGVEGTNLANSNWAMLGTPYYAVDARAESGSGVRAISTTDHGVTGRSEASDSAGIYGVNEDGGYAGYFHGKVEVTGNLSKGGGAFKIDHPLDPANRYLQHSFVESPDMMNVYNGNVVLDETGEAWIVLPDWFDVLNRDFRYQLTCVGGFSPAYVATKLTDNRFRIAGGDPGLEISWQITGIRHDPWAEANRIEVEPEKNERERGFYIHPDLYGKSAGRDVTRVNREPPGAQNRGWPLRAINSSAKLHRQANVQKSRRDEKDEHPGGGIMEPKLIPIVLGLLCIVWSPLATDSAELCDDNDDCTSPDECIGGACVPPVPNPDAYVTQAMTRWSSYLWAVQFPALFEPVPEDCCFDYTGDGNPDDAFGGLLGMTAPLGGDPVGSVNSALENGELVKVFDWRELTPDLLSGDVQLSIFDGQWTDSTTHTVRILGLGHTAFRRASFGPFGAFDQLNEGTVTSGLVEVVGDQLTLALPWFSPTTGIVRLHLHQPMFEAPVIFDQPPPGTCLGLCSVDEDRGAGHTPQIVGGGKLGGVISAGEILEPMDAFYRECTCVQPAGFPGGPTIVWQENPVNQAFEVWCTFTPLAPGDVGYTCLAGDPCGDMHDVCQFLPVFPFTLDVDLDGSGINESWSVGLRLGFAGTTLDPMLELFADGFESGDTLAWSSRVP